MLILLALMGLFSNAALAQVAPPLGQANSFSVLAGSAVTNTGPTAVIGDLGVSPGSAITGFPPGSVTGGTTHSNDAVAQGAQNDVTTAYNTLAGEASDTDLTGQDLGGLTLVSGVYTFSSSAQLTGTLTLDAQGNSAAVFVFQIGSTLTTASNANVVIINGGTDCNVFWQVGSSATLGTTTAFIGNILALTSITLTTGTSVSGRVLARNGAVTMDSNDVTVCGACSAITLAPAALPAATIGAAYAQTLTASGGTAPYSFSVIAGALPAGLSLSAGGVISGTPTGTGSFTFTIRATDSAGCFGDQEYTLVINAAACGTVTLAPATLPATVADVAYSQTLTAAGGTGPYTFAVVAGALPAGLSLATNGLLSGTPTNAGSYSFTVRATDSLGCSGDQAYTVVVNAPTCAAIAITPAILPAPVAGVAYSEEITATGGTAPYTFAVVSGALPAGLALSAASGSSALISGVPTRTGAYTFVVQVTDAAGCIGTQTYSGTIVGVTAISAPALSLWGLIALILMLAIGSSISLSIARRS
ncbi:MAG TPA: ice-binding family protein [Dokdonella sp.]